jgi:hypothetical protein
MGRKSSALAVRLARSVDRQRRGELLLAESAARSVGRSENEVGRGVDEPRAVGRTPGSDTGWELGVDRLRKPRRALAIGDARERRQEQHASWPLAFEQALELALLEQVGFHRARTEWREVWASRVRNYLAGSSQARALQRGFDSVRAEEARSAKDETRSCAWGRARRQGLVSASVKV